MRALALAVVVTVASFGAGCAVGRAPSKESAEALTGGSEGEYAVPGFDKRNYILHLPPSYQPGKNIPVVFALHGGGGSKQSALKVTCKNGNTLDDSCITKVADQEGFAVVLPDGTGNLVLENVRTWNAGGGADGWQCVSGDGCINAVDEMAFFDALFDEVVRAVNVDENRVHATGISNGGAMAHRLACERSLRFASIASVGGGNQLAMVQGCTPGRPISVLEIHGDEDPCWSFETSTKACSQQDGNKKIGVNETIEGWTDRDGCTDEPEVTSVKDAAEDNTTAKRKTFTGCEGGAEVELITVKGGGHTWPQGWQYAAEDRIGRVSQDFSGSREVWSFFENHPRPH